MRTRQLHPRSVLVTLGVAWVATLGPAVAAQSPPTPPSAPTEPTAATTTTAPATPTTSSPPEAPEESQPAASEALLSAIPLAIRIANFAPLHPQLAASLVPDAWLELLLEGAHDVAAEEPAKAEALAPPVAWPIGPWSSSQALAGTVGEVDAAAIGSLYRALRPRIAARCTSPAPGFEACERAIRTSVSRLGSDTVLARADGRAHAKATRSQRELARLGTPAVRAIHHKLGAFERALWGSKTAPRR